MLLPDRVEIELESGSEHCMMYRYTRAEGGCGDTWHESLDAAFMQAEHEYGLSASDFLAVHEGQPDGSRDGAA